MEQKLIEINGQKIERGQGVRVDHVLQQYTVTVRSIFVLNLIF